MSRFVAALGILLVLIGLAWGFTIWNPGSGERGRDTGKAEPPARSPRSLGASTLSHGGPAPSPMPQGHESGPVAGPFLEPGFPTPKGSSVSQGAGGKPVTNRSPQTEGTPRGSGGRGP